MYPGHIEDLFAQFFDSRRLLNGGASSDLLVLIFSVCFADISSASFADRIDEMGASLSASIGCLAATAFALSTLL